MFIFVNKVPDCMRACFLMSKLPDMFYLKKGSVILVFVLEAEVWLIPWKEQPTPSRLVRVNVPTICDKSVETIIISHFLCT